jgi:hypothetical protein
VTVPAPAHPTGGLADTLNILLDKGLVIDATVRVSALGIEVLTIEARIVIASVDTFIRYLEAMQRLNGPRIVAPGQLSQGIAHTTGLIPQPPAQAIAVATAEQTPEQPATPPGKSGGTKS